MGDRGGFAPGFRDLSLDFAVVLLPDLEDGDDGEESSVCTNRTSISSRSVPIGPASVFVVACFSGGFACRSRGDFGGVAGG